MKLLHCADIHLGRRPVGGVGEYSIKRFNDYFDSFAQTISTAILRDVDVVMITGDLFDRREIVPEVLQRTEAQLARLKQNDIAVVLTEGNHDNISSGKESESWLVYLENKGYVQRPTYVFDENGYRFHSVTIDDHHFYGVGYPGSMVHETLEALAVYLNDKKDQKNIVMVHTAIASNDYLPGTVEKKTIERFRECVLYLAGGHFHSFQVFPRENPFFFIPGSLEYWDITEDGTKKGMVFFDTDTRTHEFIQSTPRPKISVLLNIDHSEQSVVCQEIKEYIDNLSLTPAEDIVVLTINLPRYIYIDIAWCEELLVQRGALKAIVHVSVPQDHSLLSDREQYSIEQIEKEILGTWDFLSTNLDHAVNIFNSLKTCQKEARQEHYIELFDMLMDSIVAKAGHNEN